ncbi:serine hydrolase domain-containing protein [Alterisphingorhabdus coralli]|uniref:Serine hydrolase domain-containing protein n=1 Tax=Alterisphingorhabdus coralli TaxID=3071408 RepID=A0AA97I2J0_9SPHN|nr:serine hydrolase domain-containing protein [Parasphingorhabdus sp. SCSIO 66989]WOE75800.1 serine hydrolase domain-containing protein [Parasphingorhabdus sp. SCSIO 66989]
MPDTRLAGLIGFCLSPMLALPALAEEQPAPVSIELQHRPGEEVSVNLSGDAGAKDRAVRADMPVRIASISKLVTALGVMRLVDQGRLDLDRDVGDYLGWPVRNPHFPDRAVTLRMLLSHTASLSDAAGYYLPLDGRLQDLVADSEAWHQDHAPGSGFFDYANLGSPIIAAVMEKATGQRYDAIMQQQVFTPLALTACFNWSNCPTGQRDQAITLLRPDGSLAKDPLLAPGEEECALVATKDGSCDLRHYVLGENGSSFSPQGGLRISAKELLVVGKLLVRDDMAFLSPAAWQAMRQTQWRADGLVSAGAAQQWALGLEVQPGGWIGHSGNAYGLRAGLWANRLIGEVRVRIVTMVDEAVPEGPCLHSCP